MKLVSVIVLAHNVEKYIKRCLKSISEQSYKNIELIVIDDASIDSTWQVVNKVVTDNKSYFYNVVLHLNTENNGAARCRNIGLSLASGDFFTFVDGDDWIEAEGIQNMVDSACVTGANIVASDFIMDKNGTTHIAEQNIDNLSNIDIIKYILTGIIHGSVCNKLYRKSFVDNLGIKFIDGADFTEDLAFNIKALIHTNKVKYSSEPYYHYCVRAESMSRNTITLEDKIDPKILQKFRNLESVTCELQKSGLIGQVNKELNYCKLGARLPLLTHPNKKKCKLWRSMFPESNVSIISYDKIGFAYKLKLMLLILRLDTLFIFISKR